MTTTSDTTLYDWKGTPKHNWEEPIPMRSKATDYTFFLSSTSEPGWFVLFRCGPTPGMDSKEFYNSAQEAYVRMLALRLAGAKPMQEDLEWLYRRVQEGY